MADTVALRATLDDAVSGAANSITKSLFKAERAVASYGKTLLGLRSGTATLTNKILPALEGALTRAVGKRAGISMKNLGASIQGLDTELKKYGLSLDRVGSKAVGAIGAGLTVGAGAAASAVAAIATAAVTAAAGLAYLAAKSAMAFSSMAIQTAAFRETTMGAFEVMLKSQGEAAELWERAVKFAAKTPFNTQEVIGGFKQLLARGFETSQLERIMTAAGDLSAAMGEPQAMPRIIRALGQIRGKSILQMEELNTQLAEVGVNTAEVVAELGKTLGKSSQEVRRMITKGAISSELGVNAILTVVERRFGGTMARFMVTLTGLWQQLASKPFELFNAALGGAKGGLNAFISIVKKALQFLVEAFDPSTERGGRLVAVIRFIGESFSRLFGMAAGGATLEGIFDGILDAIEIIVPIFTGFIEGFLEGLGEVGGPLLRLVGSILGIGEGASRMETIASIFKTIGKAVAYVVIVVGALFSLFAALVSLIVAVFGAAAGAIISAGAAIMAIFGAAISQIVQGIEKMIDWIFGIGDAVDHGIMPTEDLLGRIGTFGMQAGASLVGGIVSGIASAAGAVVGQMLALGQSAAGAFASAIPGFGMLTGAAAPMGGFGVGGAGVAMPTGGVPAPAAKPVAAEGGGPRTNTFNLTISGAGLTPDELMARARAEFSSMIENL